MKELKVKNILESFQNEKIRQNYINGEIICHEKKLKEFENIISDENEIIESIDLYNKRWGEFNKNILLKNEVESVIKNTCVFSSEYKDLEQDELGVLLSHYKIILKNKEVFYVMIEVELVNVIVNEMENKINEIEYRKVTIYEEKIKLILLNFKREINKKNEKIDYFDTSDLYDKIKKEYLLIHQDKEEKIKTLNNYCNISKEFGTFEGKIEITSLKYENEDDVLKDLSSQLYRLSKVLKNS